MSRELYSSLARTIEDNNMQEVVSFAGWLPDPRDFFEAIDVFVLASRHDEGFGLVLAEAGERGIPVVSTRSGGAVEVVVDGKTGILVDKNRPDQIAEAVQRLADDQALRLAMGKAGRERVSRHFNLEYQARQFCELLGGAPCSFVQTGPHSVFS